MNTKNLSDRSAPSVMFPRRCAAVRAGDHVKNKLPLEKILLALGSTKIFGASPVDLGGDMAGTGLPNGLVVEGFDA